MATKEERLEQFERHVLLLIRVLQNAETELAENDGYDLCRPSSNRIAINSLLVGLGNEPRDLRGNVGTEVDTQLVEHGRQLRSGYSRGYDHGFADGCAAGASHTAKTMEFVNEALFRPRG